MFVQCWVQYLLPFLHLFVEKMKKREILFNQCGKRGNCGLIIEGMFDVLCKMVDIDFLYVFLKG